MKLCDIHPFIRYLHMGRSLVLSSLVRTYDCRLFYIQGGVCSLVIEGESIPLEPDMLILLRGGTSYRFVGADNMDMIVINFDFTRVGEAIKSTLRPVPYADFDETRIVEPTLFEDCAAFSSPLILRQMKSFESVLAEIVQTKKASRLYHTELAEARFGLFLCELASHISYARSERHETVDNALDFIKTNYSRDINNNSVAAAIGYHPYYLGRLVVAETGKPLHRHILDCRLEAARELLLHTNRPILEIAEQCGFKSVSHFSSFFKSRLSLSPIAYRKAFGNRV